MPALSSSPIDPAIGHLADLAGDAEDPPGLLAVAKVTDPRHRRGIRHRLAVILGLAVCAVLAGARSYTAIAEWARRRWTRPDEGGGALGVNVPAHLAAPGRGRVRRPGQPVGAASDGTSTRVAADESRWTARPYAAPPTVAKAAGICWPLSIMLMAWPWARADVDVKSNEIPMFSALLDSIEINDAVITADALYAQHAHAEYLHQRGAHYLLTGQSASRTRLRSRSGLARPYICLLIILMRLTWPSTAPEL